jgi:hypothetical protein
MEKESQHLVGRALVDYLRAAYFFVNIFGKGTEIIEEQRAQHSAVENK